MQSRLSNDLKVDTYIAPWVLPNEDVPAYIKWYENLVFDRIIITLPDGMEFVEFLNVNIVEAIGNKAEIKEVRTPATIPCYFGFVVRSSKIFENLKVAKFIKIEFKLKGQTILSKELCCRIFRPKLEIANYPKSIEITDQKEHVLPLHLRYVGFGDVLVKMEASIGGTIVSKGDSIIYELVRRLWASTLKEGTRKKLERRRTGVKIAPDYIKKIADELEAKVDKGKLPFDGLTKKEVKQIKEWWRDIKTRRVWLDIISTFQDRIGSVLLDILKDVLERNPTSNVKLSDPRTNIITRISAPVEMLELKVMYKDVLGNDYSPLGVPIKLIDKRTVNKETLVSIPIKIERWDNEPFYDVEKIDVC